MNSGQSGQEALRRIDVNQLHVECPAEQIPHPLRLIFAQQAVVDENAEALMERMLGFSVPLSAVSDWTEGEPNRRYPFRRLDDNSFEQLGWTVRVLEREQSGAARKLAFTKGTLALVVVIDTKAGQ